MNSDILQGAIEDFYFAYRHFTERPDKILAARGLSRVHHRILYFVGRMPNVSVAGLLETLDVSKQAINVPMRQLIEMGFVLEGQGESDKRIKALRLSGAGQKLFNELNKTQAVLLAEVFEEEELLRWRAHMQKIAVKSKVSPKNK